MKTPEQIAQRVIRKTAMDADDIARFIASNTDDVLLALTRRAQRKVQEEKKAYVLPPELASSYFFSNPYGLDFHTWAGMRNTTEDEDIPTEPMPDVEDEEPPYDSETEAAYMPNAPEESTEPTVSPASPVPLPHGKHKKTASLLQIVAQQTLMQRGLVKKAQEPSDPLRQKVARYLQRKAAAEDQIPGGKAQGMDDADFDPKQIAMGAKIEKEHTPDPDKAHEIARDHLEEFPNYYTALKQMEERLEDAKSASLRGRASALAKFGIDAAELLGQDEQRKDDIHQQTVRHNEENHQIDLAKGQLELQQAQETFSMKQQQQAQKNQEQQAQQQMMMQQQQQQQQQQRMQYMSNMAGGGQQPQTQGVQQPPQQGMQGPR
jgi:hypothetical protein